MHTILSRCLPALICLVISLVAAVPASAQVARPPTIGVYSQLGRELGVTLFQSSIGSRLNSNVHQRLEVNNGAVDKVVVQLAGQAIRKHLPLSYPWLLAPTDEDLLVDMQTVAAGSKVAIPDDLTAALREQGATRLLVFTRFRADAQLQALNSREGDGQLEGLGFYVDTVTPMRDYDSGEIGQGYLAPYVHMRSTLIDVATQRVLGTRTSAVGKVISAARAKTSVHPWNALDTAEKLNLLRDMVKDQIDHAVPELLGPR